VSIRTRLVTAIALLLIATFVVFGVALVRSVRDTLVDQVDEQILQTAARTEYDLSRRTRRPETEGLNPLGGVERSEFPDASLGSGEHDEVSPASSFDVYERPVAQFVYASDGRMLVGRPSGYADDPNPAPLLPAIPSRELDAVIGRIVTVRSESRDIAYRVLVEREPSGTLVVTAVPLDDVQAALRRVVRILLWFGVATLLGVTGAIWWIIRRELRPVDQMVATATGIAAGDLTRRVPDADPHTELGKLGTALNDMLGKIEQSVAARIASEQRLRRFVSDASHELRNPLTSVLGYAELYRQGALRTPESVGNAMGRIEAEGGRMARLVDDLLMLARLDEDQWLEMAQVDLAAIAREAVDDFRVVVPDRPVDLVAPDEAIVTGDAQRLRQVIDNLLSNARIHTPEGTAVRVRVSREGGEYALRVSDVGPGLSPEQREHVFDRFWRADPARARTRGGSGLGLAIVASIAEAHAGRATVDSTPGQGATFTVHLPSNEAPVA
jgi:two-component system, OmpR family, sensor kinase